MRRRVLWFVGLKLNIYHGTPSLKLIQKVLKFIVLSYWIRKSEEMRPLLLWLKVFLTVYVLTLNINHKRKTFTISLNYLERKVFNWLWRFWKIKCAMWNLQKENLNRYVRSCMRDRSICKLKIDAQLKKIRRFLKKSVWRID